MKFIATITGVCKNIIKEIDLARLKEKYTKNGKLIKPEHQAYYLGIDEFSLHKNHVYATHIIDLERGDILWIEQSKKKQVVLLVARDAVLVAAVLVLLNKKELVRPIISQALLFIIE